MNYTNELRLFELLRNYNPNIEPFEEYEKILQKTRKKGLTRPAQFDIIAERHYGKR